MKFIIIATLAATHVSPSICRSYPLANQRSIDRDRVALGVDVVARVAVGAGFGAAEAWTRVVFDASPSRVSARMAGDTMGVARLDVVRVALIRAAVSTAGDNADQEEAGDDFANDTIGNGGHRIGRIDEDDSIIGRCRRSKAGSNPLL